MINPIIAAASNEGRESLAMAEAVGCRLVTANIRVLPGSFHARFVVDGLTLRYASLPVFRFFPAVIIPPTRRSQRHLHVHLYQKDKQAQPGNLQIKRRLFEYVAILDRIEYSELCLSGSRG